jgi:hypothetical protein
VNLLYDGLVSDMFLCIKVNVEGIPYSVNIGGLRSGRKGRAPLVEQSPLLIASVEIYRHSFSRGDVIDGKSLNSLLKVENIRLLIQRVPCSALRRPI